MGAQYNHATRKFWPSHFRIVIIAILGQGSLAVLADLHCDMTHFKSKARDHGKTLQPVRIFICSADEGESKFFVTGGMLGKEEAWNVGDDSIIRGEEQIFLKFAKTNNKLWDLCGKRLTLNKYWDDLVQLRNIACDEAIQEAKAKAHIRDKDFTKTRTLQFEISLPESIFVDMPYNHAKIKMQFVTDSRSTMAIELNEETLNQFVLSLWECEELAERNKKPRTDPPTPKRFLEIKWCQKRSCYYTNYHDADGVMHTKFEKVPSGETGEKQQEDLHDFFLQNNHVLKSDDVNSEHAAREGDRQGSCDAEGSDTQRE